MHRYIDDNIMNLLKSRTDSLMKNVKRCNEYMEESGRNADSERDMTAEGIRLDEYNTMINELRRNLGDYESFIREIIESSEAFAAARGCIRKMKAERNNISSNLANRRYEIIMALERKLFELMISVIGDAYGHEEELFDLIMERTEGNADFAEECKRIASDLDELKNGSTYDEALEKKIREYIRNQSERNRIA